MPAGAQAGDVDGAGQVGCRRETVWLPERPRERAVPAHRQAGHERVLPADRDPEQGAEQAGQRRGEERPVAAAVGLVGVEAALRLRHDDVEAERCGVTLDRRPAQPDRVVVAESVQEVQDRWGAIGRVARHADPGGGPLRQQDRHRRAVAQRLGEEVAAQCAMRRSSRAGAGVRTWSALQEWREPQVDDLGLCCWWAILGSNQ